MGLLCTIVDTALVMLRIMVALGAKAIVTFSLLSGAPRQMRIVGALAVVDLALAPVVMQNQHNHLDMEDQRSVEAGFLLLPIFETVSWVVWAKAFLLVFVLH